MSVRDTVKKKLERSILPRIEGARAIRRHPRYVAYNVNRYVSEIALVILGLGLSHPAVVALSGENVSSPETVLESIESYSAWVLVMAAVIALPWIVMKAYVSVEKLSEKGPLARACIQELERAESDLNDLLLTPIPTKTLSRLQATVKATVDRAHVSGAWPWSIGPPGDDREQRYVARANQLCEQYGDQWEDEPVDQVEPQGAAI